MAVGRRKRKRHDRWLLAENAVHKGQFMPGELVFFFGVAEP